MRANSLIVSYKLPVDGAVNLLSQNDKNKAKLEGEGLMTSVVKQFESLDEFKQGQLIKQSKIEAQRLYQDLARFTYQIMYVARNKISSISDLHMLELPQRKALDESYIDLY